MNNKFPQDFIEKSNPVGNDNIIIADSQDGNNTKKSLLSSLWSAIFGNKTSDDIPEGAINKYYTDARAALKEDAFIKNTAFNKNFGTNAGEVAEGNKIGNVGTKAVDETAIADGKTIQYNVITDKYELVDFPTGGGTGLTLYDGYIAGEQVVGNVFTTPVAGNATLNKFKISLEVAPAGVDFIAEVRQNGVAVATATILTTTTATNGLYIATTTLTTPVSLLEDDKLEVVITQVGSTVAGSGFTFSLS